jgi:hypothetical protein
MTQISPVIGLLLFMVMVLYHACTSEGRQTA